MSSQQEQPSHLSSLSCSQPQRPVRPGRRSWSAITTAINAVTADSAANLPTDDLPAEILPGLFLGDAVHAASFDILTRLKIVNVLNATLNIYNFFQNNTDDHAKIDGKLIRYMRLSLADQVSQSLREAIPVGVNFITESLERGENVLVHCQAGASRSASLVTAYLCLCRGYDVVSARNHCVQRRPAVCPNAGFWAQLHDICSADASTPVMRDNKDESIDSCVKRAWAMYQIQLGSAAANACWEADVRACVNTQQQPDMRVVVVRALGRHIVVPSLYESVHVHRGVVLALGVLLERCVLSKFDIVHVFEAAVASVDMDDLKLDVPLAETYLEEIKTQVKSVTIRSNIS